MSGSVISLLATPISLVKVQQQVATTSGVVQCVKNIYRQYGFQRFYRGYCAMFIMESYGRGVYLGTYEAAKIYYPDVLNAVHRLISPLLATPSFESQSIHHSSSSSSSSSRPSSSTSYVPAYSEKSLLVRMLAAATAGCVSWTSVYPLDVIKSQLQLDIAGDKYTSCYDCYRKLLTEGGGWRRLTQGISYTLIRAAPVAATILPLYEITKEFLDKFLDN